MKLAVYGKESLQELRSMVEEKFAVVKNSNLSAPEFSGEAVKQPITRSMSQLILAYNARLDRRKEMLQATSLGSGLTRAWRWHHFTALQSARFCCHPTSALLEVGLLLRQLQIQSVRWRAQAFDTFGKRHVSTTCTEATNNLLRVFT